MVCFTLLKLANNTKTVIYEIILPTYFISVARCNAYKS